MSQGARGGGAAHDSLCSRTTHVVSHWRSLWRRTVSDYLLSVVTAISDHAPAASMRWTEGASRSIYQTVPV
jgi:hypothetical protein